jgi:porin
MTYRRPISVLLPTSFLAALALAASPSAWGQSAEQARTTQTGLTEIAFPTDADIREAVQQRFPQASNQSKRDQAEITAAEQSGLMSSDLPGSPKPAGHPREWFKEQFLTGDWGGARKWLDDQGISFNGSIVSDLLGNVTGGRSQGWEPASSFGFEMIADLEKLADIRGASIHTSMIWRAGNNLSANYIGNLLTVAQLYGGQNVRLYSLYWRQALLDDEDLVIKIGRMGAFDDFLSSPIYWNYINNGFDGNPKGIFFNIGSFGNTVYPTSSWGLFVQYSPDDWYIQAGAFPINHRNGYNNTYGLNFTFDFDQGVGVLAQGGYRLNFKDDSPGLPGLYSMGLFTSTDDFQNFDIPQGTESPNGGLYWMLQQMVYREPGQADKLPGTWGFDAQEGLTLWSVIVWTPDSNLNPYPVYPNIGAVYQGPIPGRPQDFAAFGLALLAAGDDFQDFQQATAPPAQDYEMVIELNYRINFTRYFYVQPGMQYVIQPGGTGTIPDALVLGGQVAVVF